MNTNTLRTVVLPCVLAGLLLPTRTQAQAPMVANNSVTTVAGVAHLVDLSLSTTWTGSVYTLSYSIIKQPASGVITFHSGPTYTYYRDYQCTNLNYLGPDSFTWKAATGSLVSAVATCTVAVVAPVPPTAAPYSLTTAAGASIKYS